ncbi:MAG: undecaprenyl-diphosphatase [Candidatus Peregrinibacteria bacterium Greene0416_19]|nr:MAG: undecaprenyl-diphosphatase [Candidatus Peregrinibacteria bacterium Greene0416_19]
MLRMSLLQSLILGAVEGVTEFLPISSTGHLVLASQLLQVQQTEFLKSFEIAIQLGAILAVVVLYGRALVLNPSILARVATAFIPTGVIGFLVYRAFKQYLIGSTTVVLWSLFLGGIILILCEWWHRDRETAIDDLGRMTYPQAFLIGCCQAIAIVPGVSRSAATVLGGMFLGIRRRTIVDFSFLLAIPTMGAATGYDLLQASQTFSQADAAALAVGFIASFVVALLSIRWLVRFIRTHTFAPFGIYRICIALLWWLLL